MKSNWSLVVGMAVGLHLLATTLDAAPGGRRSFNSRGVDASRASGSRGPANRGGPGPSRPRPGDDDNHGHDVAHVHVVADVRSGAETWSVEASPFGVFPTIVNHESEVVLVNLKLPQVRPGTSARAKVLNDGWLAPAQARTGIIPSTRARHGRWLLASRARNPLPEDANRRAIRRWQGRGALDQRVGPDRVVAFYFHYGEGKHAQFVDVTVGDRLYRFEFHLHPPGSDEAH